LADIFDVTLTSGGTKAFTVGPAGLLTIPFGVASVLIATGLTSITTPTGAAVGDVVSQRTSSTGRFSAGGVAAGTADYNILNANAWTFQNSATFAPIFAGAYTNSSDAKFKTNVVPITGALDLLAQLKPSSYNWVADDQPDFGFIAQDVEAVLPQLVRTSGDNSKGLVYTGFTAINSAAIVEMAAKLKSAGVAGF
jgi:hypothetical protein